MGLGHTVQLRRRGGHGGQGGICPHRNAVLPVCPHRAGRCRRRHGLAAHIGAQVRQRGGIGLHRAGGGIHAENAHHLARQRLHRERHRPHILCVQLHRAALAVHAQHLPTGGCIAFCPQCGSLRPLCAGLGIGTVGQNFVRSLLRQCRLHGGICRTVLGTAGAFRCGVCAFQHARHKLLVHRGRQLLTAAVRRQGGVHIVAAGAGIGGVAAAAYGGQHPLSPHAAGQAAVNRHTVVGVQRNGGQLHPIAAAQIQRQGAPRPRCGQDELQPVHPLGVLCAKVQPVRPGHKFGAAALLLKDLDLHAKPPFLFAVPIVPPGAQNYPVCTKNVKFSVLRHFAKRGFGTGNASFFPLPEPGNSPAGFPCKTRDVGQLVLGAAAAAAALFAEKRAGANVKNS